MSEAGLVLGFMLATVRQLVLITLTNLKVNILLIFSRDKKFCGNSIFFQDLNHFIYINKSTEGKYLFAVKSFESYGTLAKYLLKKFG